MGGLLSPTGYHFTLLSKVQLENNSERSEIEFIPTYTHPPLDVLECIGEVVGRQREELQDAPIPLQKAMAH